MLNQVNLTIADYSIHLHSDFDLELEDGFLPFIDETPKELADISIECFKGIPFEEFSSADDLVFEARNEVQKFYTIYRMANGLLFYIYNQQKIDQISHVAHLNENYTDWKIYTTAQENGKINALKYPLGPIIMHYLTVKSEAIMIHASCIFDGSKGRLFTGFSGRGKSTMSKLWADAGNLVINDDRIIIRKQNNYFYAYNTPMYYKDKSKKTRLDSIFLISHSPENRMTKLSGATAVSRVMAFCIQNNFDSLFIQNNLDFLSDLSTQIGIYDLGFVPDESIVTFIQENESTTT